MKQKKYEKKGLICICVFCLWLLQIGLIGYLQQTKIIKYKNYQLIQLTEKEALLFLPKKEKQNWYKNNHFYWNNKKYKFQIVETIEQDSSYLQMKVSFSSKKKRKENEVIQVFIENKRINMIEVIKNTWGGDNNRKSS